MPGRALARAQRHGIASRRRRGLNSAVVQPRFGGQKLRLRSIDGLPLGRRRQQRTVVRGRDSWVRAVMPVRRDMRASVRAAPQKQQERRGKQAHQGTKRCHLHVSGYALTNCSNVRGSAPKIKRQLTRIRLQSPASKALQARSIRFSHFASAQGVTRGAPHTCSAANPFRNPSPLHILPSSKFQRRPVLVYGDHLNALNAFDVGSDPASCTLHDAGSRGNAGLPV